MRVLLIDPDEGFRRGALSLLESIPFVEFADGAASIEQVGDALSGGSPPDVVLLALAGPHRPRTGLLQEIGNAPSNPRVVALTVFYEPEYTDGLRRTGAHDWLPKSDFAAALMPCLRRLLPSFDPRRSDPHPPMASEVSLEAAISAGRQPQG